jgi:hypothetical protein
MQKVSSTKKSFILLFVCVDVLTNIRNLSRSIKQGNDDEADRMAKELASQNIRLQVKSLKQVHTEEEFR